MSNKITILLLIILISFFAESHQFKQWQSDRFNIHDNDPLPYIYGWKTFPFTKITNFISTYQNTVWFQATYQDELQEAKYELYQYKNDKIIQITGTGYISENSKFLVTDMNNQSQTMTLLIVSEDQIFKYFCQQQECRQKSSTNKLDLGQISALQYSEYNQSYMIASEKGLYQLPVSSFNDNKQVDDSPVTALSINNKLNILAYTTESKIIFLNQVSGVTRYEWLKSLAYTKVSALAWRESDNSLWMGSSTVATVFQFYQSSFFNEGFYYINWQISGQEGLPVPEISTIQIDQQNGSIFMCGKYGISLFDGEISDITAVDDYSSKKKWQGVQQYASPQSPWKYFYQQRWMPTGEIQNYSLSQNGDIWILTEYGVAHMYQEDLTYEDKEANAQKVIKERHSFLGYVTNSSIQKPGDLTTSKEDQTSDNQGLWTNLYLASLAYKYKVTQDEQTKKQAWEIFNALERGYAVIPPKYYGLMAKAVMYKENTLPDEKWFYSTNPGYEEFMYKGNASSDDVTSYFYAFPIFMEYICETQKEKDLVLSYLIRTIDYIIENNYQMLNVDGERTMWGFWNPENLNDNPDNYSEKCLNSMEILSFLAVVYKYTGDGKYLDEMDKFINHGYIQNSLNWRYQDPADVNFSDDELGYMALATFFFVYEDQSPTFQEVYLQNLIRSFSIVQEYQPSWYIYITALSLKQNKSLQKYYDKFISNEILAQAEQELIDWPTDWINWNVDNSKRIDLSPMRNKFGKYTEKTPDKTFMNYVVNKGERLDNFYWNSDPYEFVNTGINGNKEFSTQPWLLPYWMKEYLAHFDQSFSSILSLGYLAVLLALTYLI